VCFYQRRFVVQSASIVVKCVGKTNALTHNKLQLTGWSYIIKYSMICITAITIEQNIPSSDRYVCSWHCHCHTTINVYVYCRRMDPGQLYVYNTNISTTELTCRLCDLQVNKNITQCPVVGYHCAFSNRYFVYELSSTQNSNQLTVSIVVKYFLLPKWSIS